MDLQRISTDGQVSAYAKNYRKYHDTLICLQYIPVIGIIGGAGVLILDLKAWIINRIFVDSQKLQTKFANSTYNFEYVNDTGSARQDRIFSALNILSGGIFIPIFSLVDFCSSEEPTQEA